MDPRLNNNRFRCLPFLISNKVTSIFVNVTHRMLTDLKIFPVLWGARGGGRGVKGGPVGVVPFAHCTSRFHAIFEEGKAEMKRGMKGVKF